MRLAQLIQINAINAAFLSAVTTIESTSFVVPLSFGQQRHCPSIVSDRRQRGTSRWGFGFAARWRACLSVGLVRNSRV